MTGILREIQPTVEKYAAIMAKIAKVDVEVVDTALFRVAGTGVFSAVVNMDMSTEGYAYRQVLHTGKLQVIYSPGKDPICQQCPRKNNCTETIEIAMPIVAQNEIIGVIGLVGSSDHQRDAILADEETYIGLIEQIASFIAGKAVEQTDQKKKDSMWSALACTIDHMEQAILILGGDARVTMANQETQQQLGLQALEGLPASITPTGDKLGGQSEYVLRVGEKTVHVLGSLYFPYKPDERYAQVFVFTRTRDMHKKLYAMTAAVNTDSMIGSSEATCALRAEIAKIADSTSTVLITGESGTGKEVAATAIWRAGNRSKQQFVALNCAAIPESLLESELFGYVKGAFTGADPNGRVGKFELANRGVIFLDEIGDMPLYLQAKLLRVIQERKITRIGSNQLISVDVRIIAATNKDLRTMIADGKFREDLYYRLNVIPLKILPLRERVQDIPDLVDFFVLRYAERFGKARCRVSAKAMRVLQQHPWYGNVRELENTVEFMVNMSDEEGVLGLETLPREFVNGTATAVTSPAAPAARVAQAPQPTAPPATLQAAAQTAQQAAIQAEPITPLHELERLEIAKALALFGETTKGKRQAAQSLGVGLATLYRKLEQLSAAAVKSQTENSQKEN